jgi:hypothetical protein
VLTGGFALKNEGVIAGLGRVKNGSVAPAPAFESTVFHFKLET